MRVIAFHFDGYQRVQISVTTETPTVEFKVIGELCFNSQHEVAHKVESSETGVVVRFFLYGSRSVGVLSLLPRNSDKIDSREALRCSVLSRTRAQRDIVAASYIANTAFIEFDNVKNNRAVGNHSRGYSTDS
ncbi:putative NSs protein [Spilikins virus]|uniref:NSs protein n=1 Tax=Spilikins virus TaxID=2895617 RepID=A0AAE8ZP27_9VIRU|nr:putative NSs protein [Spilikins virus]